MGLSADIKQLTRKFKFSSEEFRINDVYFYLIMHLITIKKKREKLENESPLVKLAFWVCSTRKKSKQESLKFVAVFNFKNQGSRFLKSRDFFVFSKLSEKGK